MKTRGVILLGAVVIFLAAPLGFGKLLDTHTP